MYKTTRHATDYPNVTLIEYVDADPILGSRTRWWSIVDADGVEHYHRDRPPYRHEVDLINASINGAKLRQPSLKG